MEEADQIQEDISMLSGTLHVTRLPQLNAALEKLRPFDLPPTFQADLDFSALITVQHAHETQRAVKSVRTQYRDDSAMEIEPNKGKELSAVRGLFAK